MTQKHGVLYQGSKSHHKTASDSAPAEEPMQTTQDLKEPSHQEFKTGAADDEPIAEASQHPEWLQQQKKPPTPDHTLTSKLLARLTYELMKGSCKSLVEPLPLIPNSRGRHVIPFDQFINNDLKYLRGGASSRKYITSVTKTKATDYGHIKWIEDLVPHTMWSQEPVGYDKYSLLGITHWGHKHQWFYGFVVKEESARDVYLKLRIIVVTELQIIEWHDYKHLDWITVCKDNDKLYKFKEGDFKRLHIQDIKDMLPLLHRHLTACRRFLTRCRKLPKEPDTYRSDLKRKEAYITYSNLRGFIYQNKDKQNRLMRIDELHKLVMGRSMMFELHWMIVSREILLKLNLPDHKSILTDSQVTSTKRRRMTKPCSPHHFIANCFNARHLKMEVKMYVPNHALLLRLLLLDLLPCQTYDDLYVVFDGAFGGVRDEEVVVGEGVVVISSSLDMLTNSCLGGIMVSLIFLEGLDEEALVEFMIEWCEEDEDYDRNEDDGLFN
nr:hypothetical protein [Tanacetum cinerariifolium]